MGIIVIILFLYPHQPNILTVPGDDYTVAPDQQQLEFPRGSRRACHNISILQDDMCERNETFSSSLSLLSGMEPIIIDPSTAQVVIVDDRETECSKYHWLMS